MNAKIYSKGILILSIAFLAVVASPPTLSGAIRGGEMTVYKVQKDIYKYHFKDDDHGCEFCHKNVEGRNFQLPADESKLCYDCHTDWNDAKWVHGPIGAGQCSICHDPHGTKTKGFLIRKGDRVCYYCHSEARVGPHSKEKGGRSCVYCHDPHSSDSGRLMLK